MKCSLDQGLTHLIQMNLEEVISEVSEVINSCLVPLTLYILMPRAASCVTCPQGLPSIRDRPAGIDPGERRTPHRTSDVTGTELEPARCNTPWNRLEAYNGHWSNTIDETNETLQNITKLHELHQNSDFCCKANLGPSNSSGNWPAPHKVCAAWRELHTELKPVFRTTSTYQ